MAPLVAKWLAGCGFGLWVSTLSAFQVSIPSGVLVPDDQTRQFITHLYQEYYLRVPTANEVDVWMRGVRQGQSLEEIHAAFLGSDEYYAKNGRNDWSWLNGMYLTVTNRQPSKDDLTYWSNRLRQVNGDRRRVASEFLRSNVGGSTSGPSYDPGFNQLPNQQPYATLPSQLVTSAQQLSQSVRSEFSGWNGTILQLQANSLANVVQQSQTSLLNAGRDPAAAQAALQRVNSAVQGMNSQFQSTSGGASSRYYLDQINRIVRALGDSLPGSGAAGGSMYPPYYPPATEETLSRTEARRIAQAADRLLDQMKQAYSVVQDLARYDFRYSSLVNDIGQLAAEIQNYDNAIYEGLPKSRLRERTLGIRGRLQDLGGRLQYQSVDVRLSQAWFSAIQAFDRLSQEVGGLDPNTPAAGNVDWNRVQAIQRPTDQALAFCDLLLFQFNPYYYYGNPYSRFIDEVRGLRNTLADLRGNLNYNLNDTVLQAGVRGVDNAYRAVERAWNDLLRQTGTINNESLNNLSFAIRELTAAADRR